MYANKLAVAVKHRGKVLQEFGEVVYLPFGSEYGLLIKNLNVVRASVKVSIDGLDVTQGVNLVVPPNSSIDLERFIKNGNLNAGNRFKFIERNAAVLAHRGARPDDGLIRVTYAFELPVVYAAIAQPNWPPQPSPWQSPLRGTSIDPSWSGTCSANAKSADSAGITAPGSVSHQQFQAVSGFQTGPELPPIIIQLAGQSAETGSVQNVVYTRTKVDCTVCGAAHKPSARFCSQCGASLNIIG